MTNDIKLPNIYIGCDPELFVKKKSTGQFVSAHDLLPGTKENPFSVRNGAVQVDGAAAEFNTEPCSDPGSFDTVCVDVLRQLKDMIGPDYELVCEPFVVFEPEYFKTLPDSVRLLGCSPDFNAYTLQYNPAPNPIDKPSMRTASGHIHIGWNPKNSEFDPLDPSHIQDCALVAQELDYTLGIMSLLWDPSSERRTLYGKAGCFRPKKYGIEYRVMSNKWLAEVPVQPSLVGVQFKYKYNLKKWIAMTVIQTLLNLFRGKSLVKEFGETTAKDIIDNNDVNWFYKPQYKKLLQSLSIPPIQIPPNPFEEKEKKDPNHFKKKVKKQTLSSSSYDLSPGELASLVGTVQTTANTPLTNWV